MEHSKKMKLLAKCALFGAAIIWGSSFFVVKNTVDIFTPHMLLGFRFTIGCILLAVIFRKKLKLLDKGYFISGAVIGFCLFAAYSLQTIGITDTTPGKNAFLTAIYCIIEPFLFWAVDKSKPDIYNYLAAVICIVGIGLVSLTEGLTIGFGDAFTLLGGLCFAAHMVAVAKLGRDRDPILITILQFGYAAIFAWVVGFTTESLPAVWTLDSVLGLLFLAVFATAVALLLQNVGQKYTHPSAAAIILSLESVFGVLFSVIFYGEALTPKLIIGFVLIFIAIIVSETKLSFLRKKAPEEEITEKACD